MLSFFIISNCCHVYSENKLRIHKIAEPHRIADLIPLFLSTELQSIDKVVFPLGPLSFTTVRIVSSIVKALNIVYPNAKFIGVSNFLTFFYAVRKNCDVIAINSYRGDFHYRSVTNDTFSEQAVGVADEIRQAYKNPLFDTDLLSSDTNLAFAQYASLYAGCTNEELIRETTDIEYAFTPIYRKLGE